VLSFNNDTEHQTTIERMPSENDSDKYMQLLETTREEIFSCLRINPILVGINNSNSGFTKQEFSEAYTLFQRTVIQPIQKRLERVLQTLFNTEFKFKPFSIQWEEPTQQEENKLINIEGIE
jgi:capsid portal protein